MATPEQLRAFLARPWARLRALKDRHVASEIERDGTDAAFEMAEGLRAHAEAMSSFPSDADRAEDLATAVHLRRLLDRAGSARRRRAR